jgi:hypothetical protein
MITALYDIGFKNVKNHELNEYLSWFKKLLEMKIPLIAFVDERYFESVEDVVKEVRSNWVK